MPIMLTMDRAGRIVIPKVLRDELELAPGDQLELEHVHEKLTLRPTRPSAGLHKKQGMWVYSCGESMTGNEVEKAIQDLRLERERHALGKNE